MEDNKQEIIDHNKKSATVQTSEYLLNRIVDNLRTGIANKTITIRPEHRPIIGDEHNINFMFLDDYAPPVHGRFNCAGKYIFDDPAHVVFFGHDLNSK